jgi:hypothetical protein
MLSTLILLGGMGALAPPPVAPSPPTQQALLTVDDREHLPWFDGTFKELMARAKSSDKLVFLSFWTDW